MCLNFFALKRAFFDEMKVTTLSDIELDVNLCVLKKSIPIDEFEFYGDGSRRLVTFQNETVYLNLRWGVACLKADLKS